MIKKFKKEKEKIMIFNRIKFMYFQFFISTNNTTLQTEEIQQKKKKKTPL